MKELQRRLAFKRIFNKSAQLPQTEEEIIEWFKEIACDLSPENLACDGEASPSAVRAKLKSLNAEWKALETLLGRKVTEDELVF